MWKSLKTVVSLCVTLVGVVLYIPTKALDALGRLLTILDLRSVYDGILDWIAANPRLAVDIGPWVLIPAGVVSLLLTHGHAILQMGKRWPGMHQTSDNLSPSDHSAAQITGDQKPIPSLPTPIKPPPRPAGNAFPTDFSAAEELRMREANFAKSLRQYSNILKIQQETDLFDSREGMSVGDTASQSRLFHERTSRMQLRTVAYAAEFTETYRPVALQLERELKAFLSRLGIFVTIPNDNSSINAGVVVLRHGMLAGVDPVGGVADYLDFLAARIQTSGLSANPPAASFPSPVLPTKLVSASPSQNPTVGVLQPNKEEYAKRPIEYFFDIMQKFNGLQAQELVKPYVGKRIIVDGTITVPPYHGVNGSVSVAIGLVPNLVICNLDNSFVQSLMTYNSGDHIRLDGVLSVFESINIQLSNCEFFAVQ